MDVEVVQHLAETEAAETANDAKSNDSRCDLLESSIDDQEFDIPPLQNLPTLESILNAPDDDDLSVQQCLLSDEFGVTAQTDYCEVASISSQESSASMPTPTHSRTKSQKVSASDKHGVVFRHVNLKSISSQILSAADKVDAGLPTALAVSSTIAIGTSHGLVLVFDPKQVLRWCLGSTAVGAQYGAVSALSFNVDCTRLLCGFARGQITMWNLTNGKLLRTVLDANPPGTAVLHVKFTDDRTVAVTSNSGGSVFQLEFKRLMGVRTCNSQCLFSGSRGEACVIEPLCTQQFVPEHPMKDVAIVAMASFSKVLVVVIKPHLRVHYVHPLQGDSSTLPLLCWQYVVIQVSNSDRIIDPVLAFARDRTVYFAQVVCHSVENIKVTLLQKSELPYKLLAMTWINSRTMVFIDTSERAHLVDVKTEEEIQVLDLADVQLAYSTSFYKSLATGGNVSMALAYAGERACYQSVVTFNNQLILLGTRGVHVLTLRSWSERINALARHQKYRPALDLGLAFYKGEAKAVVGLSWNPAKRKATVDELMKNIILQFADASLTTLCPDRGTIEDLRNHFHEVVEASLRYCVATENSDFLFGLLYERLSQEVIAKEAFFDSLEPFILDGSLSYIRPAIMQSLIKHYKDKEALPSLESCIFHLDISSLDIHQVVSLCLSHGLYDTLFHVYNKGMGDYVTPLVELLTRLNDHVAGGKRTSDEGTRLGNKILVYISCCLSGRGYPFGEIPECKVGQVGEQVLLCITSLHSPSHPADEQVYPYLRTLITFDTREFFNALALAFRDSKLQSKEKQRVVDILLLLMIENVGFTPSQIGILFVFLGRQMSQVNSGIKVKSILFEQVLETLCTSDRSRHEEREQIMIEFLKTGVLEKFHKNDSKEELRLVSMAEAARFFRVVELLHRRQRRFDLALSAYWRDASRRQKIFSFVRGVLDDESVTAEEKESLKKEMMDNLDQFVKIDAAKTSGLLLDGFRANVLDIVERFAGEEEVLFPFLQGTFEQMEKSLKDNQMESDRKKVTKVDAIVYEKYIELMCKYRVPQEKVIEFLRKNSSSYRNDVVLGISQRHSAKEVTCFLLEKSGDLCGAFSLTLEAFGEVMVTNRCSSIETKMSTVLEFLQRNSKSMTTEQTRKFWFRFLDLVLDKQQELKGSKVIAAEDELTPEWTRKVTSRVMTSGMPYLPPSLILQKIISSPAYSTGRFSELRGLVTNMIDTCSYEQVLMKTCANMLAGDLLDQMGVLLGSSSGAISSSCSDVCWTCFKEMFRSSRSSTDSDVLISFHCGHTYHASCVSPFSSLGGSDSGKLRCPLCDKSDHPIKSKGKLSRPVLPPNSPRNPVSDDPDDVAKQFFSLQKTPSHLMTLSEFKKKPSNPKQSRCNAFQSEDWLGRMLGAPPLNKN